MESVCECDVPNGGFCRRHRCYKTETWVRYCRTRVAWFQAWEEGRGPGQHPNLPVEKKPRKKKPCGGCGKPTIASMAWDLVKSGAKFMASGCECVDQAEYERRLAICDVCEFRGDERVRGNKHRCGECGCYVAVKAEAKVWECPIGKWNKE